MYRILAYNFLYRYQVYDGDSTAASLLATLCGGRVPATIHSTGRSLFFRFQLAGNRWKRGNYDITYTSSMSQFQGKHILNLLYLCIILFIIRQNVIEK